MAKKKKSSNTLPINFAVSPPDASDVFDYAVEEAMRREKAGQGSAYERGVADALGWLLGEYEDSPLD